MKLGPLLEAKPDLTRKELLRLQQELLDELDDKWNIDLDENGLVVMHEDGEKARIDEVSFPGVDDSSVTVSGDIEELCDRVKIALTDMGIEYDRVNGTIEKALPVFTIAFPTVNDAFKALLEIYSYNVYELLKHRDEVTAFAGYMMKDIIIL